MGFLDEYCTFRPFSPSIKSACNTFDCEHQDLNDFFANDCINYSEQLLGKTYCFSLDEDPNIVICLFTISNDSIKAGLLPNPRKNRINRPIPNEKRLHSYPAVLIGRLGVNKDYKRRGIGRELMDFIKSWFIDNMNKTGCRFLVVDSYNEDIPLNYYLNNGFQYLFDNEEDEKVYMGIQTNEKLNLFRIFRKIVPDFLNIKSVTISKERLRTRLMYFDLIILKK